MAKSKFADDGISPAHKPPPPPPPPSRNFGSAAARLPSNPGAGHADAPPVLKSSRPKASVSYSGSHSGESNSETDQIHWVNLSTEDKAEFFAWLDEFFSQHLGFQVGPERSASESSVGTPQSRSTPINQNIMNLSRPPPPVKTWSKPTLHR